MGARAQTVTAPQQKKKYAPAPPPERTVATLACGHQTTDPPLTQIGDVARWWCNECGTLVRRA